MKMMRIFTVILLLFTVLLAGCSDRSYQIEETWILDKEKVITFSDGESADLWRLNSSRAAFYKLPDGTKLLIIQEPSGPDNVYVSGKESYDDLSAVAQKAVSTYYEAQGILYDTKTELEKAYAEYLTCKESGTEYNSRYISQDISPTASNDRIMCFLTTVTLPMDGQMAHELRLGAVFDRETGEAFNNWDLFTLPEEDTRRLLLDAFDVDDPALQTEMEAALKPEYIILFPETLEVTFPQGTLPSQEYRYGFGLDYKELQAALQPWAIPHKT